MKDYRSLYTVNPDHLAEISDLCKSMEQVSDLAAFELLIREAEKIMSAVLDRPRIKEQYFSDFPGEIKSLGSWGGDFILATGDFAETQAYFSEKGYETILPFSEMIVQ